MQFNGNSPAEILQHRVVFVLPRSVIGIEVHMQLSNPVIFQEIMEVAYDDVDADSYHMPMLHSA